MDSGKPFVGVCLGLQLLFENSDEFGDYKGLGLVKGKVKKFKYHSHKNIKYPVPQIGWNRVADNGVSWEDSFLSNNHNNDFMYFVHSYFVVPENESIILSKTNYGDHEYCSSIQQDNIFACQFHPEKSGNKGLLVYENIMSKIKRDKNDQK